MGESTLQRNIRKKLKKEFRDSFWLKVHGGPYQAAGLGDLIGCVSGKFFMLEVKDPNEDHPVSPIQKIRIREVLNAGGVACVIESVEEALEVVYANI
jgi:hypothetical protein